MNKSTEDKAREYALAVNEDFNCRSLMDAYIAGANDALAGQWQNVADVLPPDNEEVLVNYREFDNIAMCSVAYRDNNKWYTTEGNPIRPSIWMSIPKSAMLPSSEQLLNEK